MCLNSVLDNEESGPTGGLVGIHGKHLMEISSTALLLPTCLSFTCNTLPRAGMCTAPHTTQARPGQPHHSEKKHPSTLKGKLGADEFARAAFYLASALLGAERMPPLRALHKSSPAP